MPVSVLGAPGRPVREADDLAVRLGDVGGAAREVFREPGAAVVRRQKRGRPHRGRVLDRVVADRPDGLRVTVLRQAILYSGCMSTIVDSMTAFGDRLRGERRRGAGRSSGSRRRRGFPRDDQQDRAGREQPDRRRARQAVGCPRADVRISSAGAGGRRPGASGTRSARRARPRAGGAGGCAAPPTRQKWRDPDTGYLRRQASTPRFPAAVTEVTLPPGARRALPGGGVRVHRAACLGAVRPAHARGRARRPRPGAGDAFELGEPRPREFRNETAADCRYVVVVTRTATP